MASWRGHLGLQQVADIDGCLPRTQVRSSRAETFQASEQIISKKLKKQLELYAKDPPSKRPSFVKDDGNVTGGPDGEQLKIYHNDGGGGGGDDAQPPAGHREGCFGD